MDINDLVALFRGGVQPIQPQQPMTPPPAVPPQNNYLGGTSAFDQMHAVANGQAPEQGQGHKSAFAQILKLFI